jgi:hypothetical protein
MLLYLLAVVLCGLLTLISIGLFIGGLVKKKQNLWIGSLIAFVVFTLLTVTTAYTYTKKAIDYMGSNEFQSETKKTAENMGKTWGNTVSGTAQGLEATLDEEAIAKLANKSGKIMGKGVTALSSGLDETAGHTTIFADESVDKVGITVGRAEEISGKESKNYGLYLEFKNDFDGTLRLTAYDSKGNKMDNSEIEVKEKAGKAKVCAFKFQYFTPGLSGYCILTKI